MYVMPKPKTNYQFIHGLLFFVACYDASSYGWDVKPLVPCVVLYTKITQSTYGEEKGSPWCSWFDLLHIFWANTVS